MEHGYVWRLKTVLRTIARTRGLRRAELAFAAFNVAEGATWIAVLVFAYGRGGATEAGLAAVIQLVPAAALAPFLAHLGDHLPPRRAMAWGHVAQTGSMAATAVTMAAGAPGAAVYACAAAAATAFTMTRPTLAASLPALVRTPDELTAANVASGWIESVGYFVGPALAALLLAVSGPGLVFGICSILGLLAAWAAAGIGAGRPRAIGAGGTALLRGSLEGFRVVVTDPAARVLVGLGGGLGILFGTLDVLGVVIAFALLHMGPGGPGVITAAIGAGGVIGGAATVALVGRRRLAPPLLLGAVTCGVALALVAVGPGAAVAVALLAVSGAGWSLSDVAGRTLLQRVTDEDVLARLFGVLEGLMMVSFAVGSLAASGFVAWFGPRGAVIAAGVSIAGLALLAWPGLRSADRSARVPAAEIELLRSVPIFAPLPAPVIERLAHDLTRVAFRAGEAVVREGEAGDRFYVVVDGRAAVSIRGERVRELGPGGHFGEIALLRDVPRTATVTAIDEMTVVALDREPFLEAVTGHPRSLQAARGVMDERDPG